MKYVIICLLAFMCLSTTTQAQTQSSNTATTAPAVDPSAPYIKDKRIPNFSLTSIDGKEITNKELPTKYKYTCIIIFSPDCSHCEHEAEEINKNADNFKNVLFIWDSYREMDLIKKFATKYNLAGQPNVVIGRDGAFTIPTFFRPRMTPFVALYDRGNFVKVWEQGVEPTELIKFTQGK
jgi:thiol-disulfide isomerase/thioredoxin